MWWKGSWCQVHVTSPQFPITWSIFSMWHNNAMQCNGCRGHTDHRWYWLLVMILAGVEQWQAAGDCNYLCIWKYKEREQNTICCSGRGRLRLVCFIDFSAISFLGGMSSEYCICCTAQPSPVSDFQYDFYNFHSFPTFLLAGEKPPWTPGLSGRAWSQENIVYH